MTSCGAVGRHQSVATAYEYARGACPTGEQRLFALRLSGVHSPAVAAIYSLSRLNCHMTNHNDFITILRKRNTTIFHLPLLAAMKIAFMVPMTNVGKLEFHAGLRTHFCFTFIVESFFERIVVQKFILSGIDQ
jgi:hypothetical protein